MNKEVIKKIIAAFHRDGVSPSFQRDIEIPVFVQKIIKVIGPRRSGKTFQLFNMMSTLLEQGMSLLQLVYINFEDERLDFRTMDLDLILQAYSELYPDHILQECYFFFDEIQNIDRWDQFIRRAYDTVSRHIFISGSNAKLLSSEIPTSLRGRSLSYKILPLSFIEYCRFKNIPLRTDAPKDHAKIAHHLADYLKYGGFPEIISFDDALKIKTLQEYFHTMIYRDMVGRYSISDVSLLKYFLKRIFSSSGKQISVNKIFNELKSSGCKIAKQRLYEYLDMVENTFLAFILKKYSPTIINQDLSEKKAYIIDNGLLNAITYQFSENTGKLMEHAVLQELIRQDKTVFLFKGKQECDFVVQQGLGITQAIQVTYDLSEESTHTREINGLIEACRTFDLKQGLIINDSVEKNIEIEGISIQYIPLLKWLLKMYTIPIALCN